MLISRFISLSLLNVVLGHGAPGSDKTDNRSRSTCTATLDGQLPSFTPSNFHYSGNVRRYYIAAEEVEWDYAPTGWDNWLGVRTKRRNTII